MEKILEVLVAKSIRSRVCIFNDFYHVFLVSIFFRWQSTIMRYVEQDCIDLRQQRLVHCVVARDRASWSLTLKGKTN